jgi:hypothetical protein
LRRLVIRRAIATASTVAVDPSYIDALATSIEVKAANLGLELGNGLQCALCDFGLIGRIAREKFGALDQMIDACWPPQQLMPHAFL